VVLIVAISRITAPPKSAEGETDMMSETPPRPSLAMPHAPAFTKPPYPPVMTMPPAPTVNIALPGRPKATLPPSLTIEPIEIPEALMTAGGAGAAVSILSVTSPVAPDGYATITVRGTPGVEYKISVIYSSGPSKASGLYPKTADSDGMVSWTWHVGPKTKPGNWEIIITGDGEKAKTHFTVAN